MRGVSHFFIGLVVFVQSEFRQNGEGGLLVLIAEKDAPYFDLKLCYEDEKLVLALLDGKKIR